MRALTLVLSAGLLLASSVATTGQAQMMQHGQSNFQHPAWHNDGRFFRRDRDHDFFRDRFFFRNRFAFSFGFPGPYYAPAYYPAYYPPYYYCGPPYYPPCPYAPYAPY